MNTTENEKPCLVEAKQGFSVSYKNKLLYSKYNPQITVEKSLENLQITGGTLILVNSPVLGYGIEILIKKLPKNSVIIAIEKDKNLFEFSKTVDKSFFYKNTNLQNLFYFNIQSEKEVIELLTNKNFTKIISCCKRVVKINLCAIPIEYEKFYQDTEFLFSNYISQFWKNRITLVKLGKLYTKNILLNLPKIANSKEIIYNSIQKPILVFGAGTSLDTTLNQFNLLNIDINNFFIICVDSAVKSLLKYGINPQIVIAVESQIANEKAFIGIKNKEYLLISDLTSRPNINKNHKNVSYIFTNFTNSNFLDSINQLNLPIKNFLPLGSVGLYAIDLAIKLRKENSPIFFTGLDFSFTVENTHCKNAPARIFKQNTSNRINSLINVNSAFKVGSSTFKINENQIFTDKALTNYATQFKEIFSTVDNLFNLSDISLFNEKNFNCNKIKNIFPKEIFAISKFYNLTSKINIENYTKQVDDKNLIQIKKFIINEIDSLNDIKNKLTYGNTSTENLVKKINQHDYLFIHFPDGNIGANENISFLKRVRNEIDFFLKILNRSLNQFEE